MYIKFFVCKNRGVREKERFLVSLLSLFHIRHESCTSGFVQFLVALWLLLYQSMLTVIVARDLRYVTKNEASVPCNVIILWS
jgi:hypothetical protein